MYEYGGKKVESKWCSAEHGKWFQEVAIVVVGQQQWTLCKYCNNHLAHNSKNSLAIILDVVTHV